MAVNILPGFRDGTHHRRCDECGEWFLAYRSRAAAFCSGRCRMAASRRRKRDGVSKPIEKRCPNCRLVKPLSEFYDRSDHGGKKPQCKPCYSAIVSRTQDPELKSAWSRNNREKLNKGQRANYARRRLGLRGWLTTNLTSRRQQCRKAGIEYTIKVSDLLDLYEEQRGLCALTGRKMKWGADTNQGSDTLSVDRVDAAGPYVRENIRLVTHWANVARQRLSDEELFAFCEAVLARRAA
jgi:hypothetical protein